MSKRPMLRREYPNRNGIPIPFEELELPESQLSMESKYDVNNHHHCFTRQAFSHLAITQTFRDLDINQTVIPKDVHCALHNLYDPVRRLPELGDMMDIISSEQFRNGMLRLGSAQRPVYEPISDGLWGILSREYNKYGAI